MAKCCLQGEGCRFEKACSYTGICVYKMVKERTPKSRWHRIFNRLFKYDIIWVCDFAGPCASCQHKQCTQKAFIYCLVNYVPKTQPYEYEHPIYGKITAYIKPSGGNKEWQHKMNTLMKFGRCQECYTTERLTIDHIIEISKGGSVRGYHNLTVLCWDCNQKKSNPNYQKYKSKNITNTNH